jgi:hypothetical protein
MCQRDLEWAKRSFVAKDIVKSTFILGDIISAVATVASMLLDLGHTRTTESESVTFNSSDRIRGIHMAGRKRPETKKESVPCQVARKTEDGVIIA